MLYRWFTQLLDQGSSTCIPMYEYSRWNLGKCAWIGWCQLPGNVWNLILENRPGHWCRNRRTISKLSPPVDHSLYRSKSHVRVPLINSCSMISSLPREPLSPRPVKKINSWLSARLSVSDPSVSDLLRSRPCLFVVRVSCQVTSPSLSTISEQMMPNSTRPSSSVVTLVGCPWTWRNRTTEFNLNS